jgi:glycosyltransferase involved in cell wall biosynthesis
MFFKQSQGFVVMSEIVKADLLSLCPQASYLLHPHPLYDHFGVKIERAIAQETLKLETGKKNLLFFGLIREYKGLDLLIDAMASLDSSYQLIIAGEPYGSFDSYRKQIEASPARERIQVFDRYIGDEEVFRFFSAADLLVLPYRQATQSGVIPIAYHFETPVLATDVGSLRATLESPGTGRVCPADGASIAAGIEKMFAGNLEDFISKIRLEKQHLSWEYFARAVTGYAATLKNVV